MNEKRLFEILRQSLVDAQHKDINAATLQQLHSERARTWVKSLALNLGKEYAQESTRVLARPLDRDKDFELHEMLYDVVVLRTAKTQGLTYALEVEWEIESELSKELKKAVIDFSKLVLGAATNKLFIGSFHTELRRDILLPIASACKSNVYAAFIPRPDDWNRAEPRVRLYKFESKVWQPISVQLDEEIK